MSEMKLGTVQDNPVVPYRPGVGLPEGIQGELNPEDLGGGTRFKQIQNVGDSSQRFPNNLGDFLLNSDILVEGPVEVSIYGAAGRYIQNLLFGSEVRPNVFTSTREVMEAGGNLAQYVKAGKDDKNYVPASELILILSFPLPVATPATKDKAAAKKTPVAKKAPPAAVVAATNGTVELSPTLTVDNRLLVPARWLIRGTAYRMLMPKLRTTESLLKREQKPLLAARFLLEKRSTKIGVNWIWSPEVTRLKDNNSDSYLGAVQSVLRGE